MIPDFKQDFLPPYIGYPTDSTQMSPYWTNMETFIIRFGKTPERVAIIEGLLSYRARLYHYGFTGFQWLSGSFVENVEAIRGRPPGDIDVVSLIERPAEHASEDNWNIFVEGEVNDLLFNADMMKETYRCDAYTIDMNDPGHLIVDSSRFWFGLFTHQKVSDNWKGIVAIELNQEQDINAKMILSQLLIA